MSCSSPGCVPGRSQDDKQAQWKHGPARHQPQTLPWGSALLKAAAPQIEGGFWLTLKILLKKAVPLGDLKKNKTGFHLHEVVFQEGGYRLRENEPVGTPLCPHLPSLCQGTCPHHEPPGTRSLSCTHRAWPAPMNTALEPSTLLFWNVPVIRVAGTASFKLSRETSWRGSLMK